MIKALFKLELLFVFQDGGKARKKAPCTRTTLVESDCATKENDVKKSQMRVEEERKVQPPSYTSSSFRWSF